jgi:hypothetical protein
MVGVEPQQARKNTRSASAVRVFFASCIYTCLACQFVFSLAKLVRENGRETKKPPLRIWKNPNFKSGE